jgi:hypothetical protein
MATGSPSVPIGAVIRASSSAPQRERQRNSRWGKGLVAFQNNLCVQNQRTPVAAATAGRPAPKPKLSGSQASSCCNWGNRRRLSAWPSWNWRSSEAVLTSTQSVSTHGPLIGSKRPASTAACRRRQRAGRCCSSQA